MKKLLFFIAIVCGTHFAQAQDSTKKVERAIFTFVDVKPEFIGGKKAWMRYLIENIKYPEGMQKENVVGRIYPSFTVSKDGTISEVKILRGISPLLNAEMIRLLENMPNWSPAKKDGEIVKVTITEPIQFPLDDGKIILSKRKVLPPDITKRVVNPDAPAEDRIFNFVEQKPEFVIGGDDGLDKYLKENVKIPAKAAETTGRVFVQFVVEKDGSVSNIKVLRGLGSGCDEEAVRVISTMPKWIAAKQNGVKVRCLYTLPVTF